MTTKTPEQQFFDMHISFTASAVRNYDINVDDAYAVEKCLREHKSELELPNLTKSYIDAVIKEARKQRDNDNKRYLFEMIKESVEAWKGPDGEFLESITGYIEENIHSVTDYGRIIHGPDRRLVTRAVALLLIEQAEWRKFQAEINAGDRVREELEAEGEL